VQLQHRRNAKLKIATWNINSVRHRLALVTRFLRDEQPDVLCLQETKVEDNLFPAQAFAKLGYTHQAVHGQKAYHGVAILAKKPFRKSGAQEFCREGHARHMGVTLENGVELHNFYVPAGGDIADPKANPKFAHKLDFLAEMEKFFAKRKSQRNDALILVGDLNVAPLENDVWNHKQLLGIVSHTPVETELLRNAQFAFDWIDVTRQFVPEQQKIYSWWSYRAADWEASDRGRRLDHVWASPGLRNALRAQKIVKKMRGWQKASDHVPVLVEFSL
jgi:exodeoxyribonuclease III